MVAVDVSPPMPTLLRTKAAAANATNVEVAQRRGFAIRDAAYSEDEFSARYVLQKR